VPSTALVVVVVATEEATTVPAGAFLVADSST